MLNIVDAELIEGNYVLYQGDLSTYWCWTSSRGWESSAARNRSIVAWPWKISNNAAPFGPAKAGL
ncbi:hypothetical protein AB8E34_00145 [Pseudomonas benzenivorans]